MNERFCELKLKYEGDFTLPPKHEELQKYAFEHMKQERKSGNVGYYDVPHTHRELVYQAAAKLHKTTKKLSKSIDTVVVIGIGGSSLGIKAVESLLSSLTREEEKRIIYLENSDPVDLKKSLKKIKKEKSLFFVISKSGGTIETMSIFKLVLSRFDIHLDSNEKNRLFIITDKDSVLSKFAQKFDITEFNIPLNVGGRFSVLSAVGMVPLLAAGYNVQNILDGAACMIDRFFGGAEEHILEKAAFLTTNQERYPINVLFGYSNMFENFTKWFVQLWAESLGKIDINGNHVGLTPIGLTGAVDQHSFLQLIIEGPRNKTVTFLKINDFETDLCIPDFSLDFIEKTNFVNGKSFNTLINAQCDATKQSLVQVEVPVDSIILEHVNEESVGQLLVYFELLTSAAGAMMHINTYDQPGVELGKVILQERFQ